MKETLPKKEKFKFSLLKISGKDIFDLAVFPAALITCLSYIAYGVILTLIPDWTTHLGLENKGIFFMIFTLSSLLVRFVAGKVSDKYGRVLIINIGLVLLIVSLLIIAFFTSKVGLYTGAFVYGISLGILSPALNAWTIDFSKPDQRGRAISTMYIALELGVGGGAFLAGWYYKDVITNIPIIMYASSFVILISLIYMFVRQRLIAKIN